MIYGVDLGTRRIAVVEPGSLHAAELWLPRLRRGEAEDVQSALRALASWFITTVPPDAEVWVEAPISGHGNVRTAIRMAETCGAVLAAHVGRARKVNLSTWKARVIGHGHADKPTIRRWLTDHHPALATVCGESQDLVDAACVALYGTEVASDCCV